MREVLKGRLRNLHVALESVYQRHNVSAILRTCDAMGLHHVHLVENREHFVPVNGASRGAERWLNVQNHAGAETAIKALQDAGVKVYVADLDDEALVPEELPIDEPLCLWFGTELIGVTPQAKAAADGVVCVPMRGFSQSLNVGVAAALTIRPVAERMRSAGPSSLLTRAEQNAIWDEWMARDAALKQGALERTT
jgi:tRNA (guanosine-2'-O-)-methyltransferase